MQANGNASATYNLSDWMINIRKMEQLGGAMGLNETLNSNLTSSSDSNNIDVHMEKNTEYGALVILSASNYGNPNKVEDGQTTTGNATGVVMNINREWVAASSSKNTSINFKNAVSRYKNIYTKTYVEKKGDAILGWHGAINGPWLDEQSYSAICRGYSGSIFSYHGKNEGNRTGGYDKATYSSRAVVVSGQGL